MQTNHYSLIYATTTPQRWQNELDHHSMPSWLCNNGTVVAEPLPDDMDEGIKAAALEKKFFV